MISTMLSQYKVLIFFALAAGFAILLFNRETTVSELKTPQAIIETKPSAYLTNAIITQYDAKGLSTTLKTPHSVFYDDHTIEIKKPHLNMTTNDGQEISALANSGILDTKIKQLLLKENVTIKQSADKDSVTTIKSEEIEIDHSRNLISSNKKVIIEREGSRMESIGMKASISEKELTLLSKVRGTYVLKP